MELVEAQRQGRRHTHIPYRDSRLTFLLQVMTDQLTIRSKRNKFQVFVQRFQAVFSMSFGKLGVVCSHIPPLLQWVLTQTPASPSCFRSAHQQQQIGQLPALLSIYSFLTSLDMSFRKMGVTCSYIPLLHHTQGAGLHRDSRLTFLLLVSLQRAATWTISALESFQSFQRVFGVLLLGASVSHVVTLPSCLTINSGCEACNGVLSTVISDDGCVLR